MERQLQQGASAQLNCDCGEGPIRLINGHAAISQRVIDTDFFENRLLIPWGLKRELGTKLFGSSRRVTFNRELIEPERELAVTGPVEKVKAAAWRQKPFQSIASQGPPGRPDHQQDHPGMHQERPYAAHHPTPGCQPTLLFLNLPSLRSQAGRQIGDPLLRIRAAHRFGERHFAELSGFAVVDPAQGGLQCRPLTPPAAEHERHTEPAKEA